MAKALPGERLRFRAVVGVVIGMHEAARSLKSRDMIEPEIAVPMRRATKTYMSAEPSRLIWEQIRAFEYAPGSRAQIDTILAEAAARSKARGARGVKPE